MKTLRYIIGVPGFTQLLQHRQHGLRRRVSRYFRADDHGQSEVRRRRCRRRGSNEIISAECKGGIINTRHPGQVSRLYKGLCETVGILVASPSQGRQVAVVPLIDATRRLANRLAPRCAMAGIEIALVGSRGEVVNVRLTAP